MKIVKTLTIILVFFTVGFAFAQQGNNSKNSKSETMKTFLIERDMPGVGQLSLGDLQGASQKSCNVLKDLGNGIEWLNSYVVDDKLFCVYKAESKEIIKEHAEKGGFPCNKIMEVKANIGPFTANGKVY